MIRHIENVKTRLNNDLKKMGEIANALERLSETSKVIDNVINELKDILRRQKFEQEHDEIFYFKKFKPEIIAIQIAAIFRYNLNINKPIGTTESQLKYFDEELNAINSFFRLNNYHYQYFKNDFTQLDSLYFTRSAGPLPLPCAEATAIEPEYSTPMSYLFGKFTAYENVQHHILEQMSLLKHTRVQALQPGQDQVPDLKWTGDAVNIIELVYGIYLTGQLNNGNASLSQIVNWLEQHLQVNIGNVQHRFAEISSRKRLSPTRFLDHMKDNIMQKIERSNH